MQRDSGAALVSAERWGAVRGLTHARWLPRVLGSTELSGRLRAALAVAVAYYVAAKFGFMMTPPPLPVAVLWTANAVMMGALILAPFRWWGVLALATLPAHLLAERQAGVPMAMVLSWWLSNLTEATIGAALIRRFSRRTALFESLDGVATFFFAGALVAPFVSSFLDAGLVQLNGWGTVGFWDVWSTRLTSNSLAALTIVPVMVSWLGPNARKANFHSLVETALVVFALAVACALVLVGLVDATPSPALLYLPLPLLVWAAIRYGPRGVSACLLVITLITIWAALHEQGPFVGLDERQNVRSLQLFLIVMSLPLLTLAAVLRERTRAQEAAVQTKERLDLAIGAARLGLWEWHRTTGLVKLSDAAREMLGTAHLGESVRGESLLAYIDPRDRDAIVSNAQSSLSGTGEFQTEFRLPMPQGGERWILCKGTVLKDDDGRAGGMRGVFTDVTTHRLASAALQREGESREREARLRELAEAMPQIVFAAQGDGTLNYFNRRWHELTESAEASDASWVEALHPDDRAGWLAAWESSVAAGTPLEHEARFRSARKGSYRWMLIRAVPVRDGWGAVARWYGSATDIDDHRRMEQVLRDAATRAQAFGGMLERRVAKRTEQLSRANETLMRQIQERERTEAALRASEERFAKAFRALPDAGMIARLPEMLIIAVNERWEQMYGYRADRAVGRRLLELGLFRQTVEGVRVLERLRSEGAVRDQEVAMRNRSGAELQVVLSGETVEVAGEPCLIVMMHDMTERRRAEDEVIAQRRQLAHLGRVAVVGELSGALAHELAQPLAAMLANAQAGLRLSRRSGGAAEIESILRDIVADLKRSDAVIQRIRALIRRDEPRAEPVDANHVVQDVIAIARADLAQRGVTVKTHLSAEIPPALCDRVQMQQVLLNLLVNASDAMASKPATAREISITSWSAGGGVRLAVADRGTGIAAEPIDTIFEPFVTSKDEGLGLGLTICRTIMQECGGKLWAQNNTRGGATFHLQLPVAAETAAMQPALSPEPVG